jgi:hypothetical protein
MLFSFVYLVFVSLLKLLVGCQRPAEVLRVRSSAQDCDRVIVCCLPRRVACFLQGTWSARHRADSAVLAPRTREAEVDIHAPRSGPVGFTNSAHASCRPRVLMG